MVNKRIVLGMSGGVDSSVCAYLLKKQGYEVIGLFMQNWDTYLNNDIEGHTLDDENQCNAQKDFNDAKLVADKLGIEIHRVEFIEKYWNDVFKHMLAEYKRGRTPNPDVLCNKYIKFSEFIDYAKKNFNCEHIAMGHYAGTKKVNGKTTLVKSKDEGKDQTYFLCWLTEDQVSKCTFPLANLLKSEVRTIAKEQKLDNWSKKDSTGVCFIGERKFKEFLSNYIDYKKGDIVNIDTNAVVGKHDGIIFYTYGQNKGLGLGGNDERFYVCGKDLDKNILYVADEKHKVKYLSSTSCVVEDFNWINGDPKKKTQKIKIRFRHRQELISGEYKIEKDKIIIKYKKTLSVTPGQFAVFYKKNTCLGGGIVAKIL